jgi:hypothetical protein
VPSGETGICWWTEPGAVQPVFLVVDGGRVVDATPYAQSWALNRTASQLLERGERLGAKVEWIPLNSVPTRQLAHLTERTRLRRWETKHDRGILSTLEFGQTPDGWTVADTTEPHLWVYADRDDTVRELRRRLAVGTWRRITASYDAKGRPAPDPELPPEWGVPD